MSYAVKETYYTLQGEGAQAGRAAVFLRFAGCNLWTGREEDRHKAICKFCDTAFVGTDGEGGGKFSDARSLAQHVKTYWPSNTDQGGKPYVVCTGGEPALQLDEVLIKELHELGFEVAIETNGTLPLAQGIDWICVSPKADAKLEVVSGNEIKLVFPQESPQAQPNQFAALQFEHYFLQPLDDSTGIDHTNKVIDYCLKNPKWRISLQTHKLMGID